MPLLRVTAVALFAFGLDRLSKIVIVHWVGLTTAQAIDVGRI